MLKNNYRKIRKKNDNDVDADVTRREYSNVFFFEREYSNVECYVLAFSNI